MSEDDADFSDEQKSEPTFDFVPPTDVVDAQQLNTNPFWISSLDLLGRDRLLDQPKPEEQNPYGYAHPVLMKSGEPVPDRYSPTGLLRSPTSDVGPVVRAGQQLGLSLSVMENAGHSHEPGIQMLALAARSDALVFSLGAYLATGGIFDYQRTGFPGFFQQYPQYRDISNFNIGVFAQQAGLSETTISRIAGVFAVLFSANAHLNGLDPQNWMATQNREMIHLGYSLSAQGAFTQPQPRVP